MRVFPEDLWETVLRETLHAVQSLVCLSTNETPYDRFLRFPRKAMAGSPLPTWLLHPGPILLRRHVRNKGDPLCDSVELVEGNQTYSVIHLGDGQESTVSISDLAPYPRSPAIVEELPTAVWTVSYPIALAIHRLPLSRQGSPPCRRALTPFRHRRVQMCLPYVGRQESGNPLIVLVIGPYNFKGGECDGFVASGCLRLH